MEKRKQSQRRIHSVEVERTWRTKPSGPDNPWMTEYMRCYSARARWFGTRLDSLFLNWGGGSVGMLCKTLNYLCKVYRKRRFFQQSVNIAYILATYLRCRRNNWINNDGTHTCQYNFLMASWKKKEVLLQVFLVPSVNFWKAGKGFIKKTFLHTYKTWQTFHPSGHETDCQSFIEKGGNL